jgi:hypothetical protein
MVVLREQETAGTGRSCEPRSCRRIAALYAGVPAERVLASGACIAQGDGMEAGA